MVESGTLLRWRFRIRAVAPPRVMQVLAEPLTTSFRSLHAAVPRARRESMTRITTSAALCVAALLLATGRIQAAAITVNNFSFEDQALDPGGWTNVTPPG